MTADDDDDESKRRSNDWLILCASFVVFSVCSNWSINLFISTSLLLVGVDGQLVVPTLFRRDVKLSFGEPLDDILFDVIRRNEKKRG